MNSKEELLKKIIEKILIPKYPMLELLDVFSDIISFDDLHEPNSYREYIIHFDFDTGNQSEDELTRKNISDDVYSLFKMVSLDEVEFETQNKVSIMFRFNPRKKK